MKKTKIIIVLSLLCAALSLLCFASGGVNSNNELLGETGVISNDAPGVTTDMPGDITGTDQITADIMTDTEIITMPQITTNAETTGAADADPVKPGMKGGVMTAVIICAVAVAVIVIVGAVVASKKKTQE